MSKRARQSSAAKMDVAAGPTDHMCLAIVDYWCGTMDLAIQNNLKTNGHWDKIFTAGNEQTYVEQIQMAASACWRLSATTR